MSEIEKKLATLSNGPGVYLMKDESGEIIYVGKARSLKKRVSSYFLEKANRDLKTGILVKKIASFDAILVTTEKEALILEANLIRKHKPRYNILLKDGKRFPSLRIDVRTSYPRLEVVRKVKKDGAIYFGPFSSAGKLRSTLKIINKTFQLRKCKQKEPPKRNRPCLNYQMGQCLGPCCLPVDRDEYLDMVNEVILFLKGRTNDLVQKIREQMAAASEKQEYELAARLRDRMFAIQATVEKQAAVTTDFVDRDVIGIDREPEGSAISVLYVRGGFLLGSRNYNFDEVLGTDSESIQAFLRQYYDKDRFIPDEVFVPCQLENMELMEQWLTETAEKRVVLHWPQRGEKTRLIEMANENAHEALKDRISSENVFKSLLERLQKRLRMDRPPRRIECFDISHTGGNQTVASMIVFEDGKEAKSEYRTFNIDSLDHPDDYAAMHEVMARRFAPDKDWSAPDVLLIDGGKGQLSITASVLDGLGVMGAFEVISIAKKDEAKKETMDKIYRPGQANPVVFGRDGDVLLFLQRVRDEAHRFAITTHRKRRAKTIRKSALDSVPGIGEKRKKALLRHFGSIKRLKEASPEDIAQVPGISVKRAQEILEALDA
ncbi:Excinuclease ABC subunit C [Desulfatibacillum alkenivorans DSM 16219]|uniref:UvrABC system protein C n=1 Tax=Desulfatibacillum alkenivorans DSM 16219 TaxID=1121393 RepID=A0A1M6SSB0_9BACT|nr:excinuclease ABC subunit UvrC [Desulfatibacillum alkenivorans]SHK47478.1 Excinuclease ABC subunit C [Desulfatibacillum alkenivorans DSM 16219]